MNSAESLCKSILLDIICPCDQLTRLGENDWNFMLLKVVGRSELILCKEQILFSSFAADSLCLTETAVTSGTEFSLTVIGKLCGRFQRVFRPFEQLCHADLPLIYIFKSRLIDDKANGVDVIQEIKHRKCAQCVGLELRIVGCFDLYPHPVLVIRYGHRAVSNNDAVGGTEAFRDIFGHINSLFEHDLGRGAILLCGLIQLHDVSRIALGALLHFSVVVRAFCQFITTILKVHLRDFAEEVAGSQLTKLMRCGALFGVLARALRKLKLEQRARGTLEPAVSAACGK